jgi:ABC-type Fe3+ transport system substrate-binding protein
LETKGAVIGDDGSEDVFGRGMMSCSGLRIGLGRFLLVLYALVGAGVYAGAAEIPRELQVPQEWIEGAKREGKVLVYGTDTPQEASVFHQAFQRRYPFITVEFTKVPTVVRFEKVLFSAKQGKPPADLVTAIGGNTAAYADAGVLLDVSNLPIWSSYHDEHKLHGKYIAGPFTRHWGLGYNTNLVARNEVPVSWEDLLQPKWKGKVAANSISRSVTYTPLWYAWGAERASKFLEGLVANGLLIRKEGGDASLRLLEAGEYAILITAGDFQAYEDQQKGAPVEWFALDPVPTTSGGLMGALKDAPHPNALRIYVNWLLSEEGQKIYAAAARTFPVHPKLVDLTPNFKDWPKRMAGKRKAVRSMEHEYESTKPGGSAVGKAWSRLVLKGL